MDRDKFLQHVAQRARIPLQEAEPRMRAMLSVLRGALSDREWREVCRHLPESISATLAAGASSGRRG